MQMRFRALLLMGVVAGSGCHERSAHASDASRGAFDGGDASVRDGGGRPLPLGCVDDPASFWEICTVDIDSFYCPATFDLAQALICEPTPPLREALKCGDLYAYSDDWGYSAHTSKGNCFYDSDGQVVGAFRVYSDRPSIIAGTQPTEECTAIVVECSNPDAGVDGG